MSCDLDLKCTGDIGKKDCYGACWTQLVCDLPRECVKQLDIRLPPGYSYTQEEDRIGG
jgi:hypothetical protein